MDHRVVPVILSGGSGSRLWPISRSTHPKQFLNLQGQHSMLHDTVRRLAPLGPSMMVLCAEEQRFLVAEGLRAARQPAAIVLEPVARNTGFAAAAAAHVVAADDPEAVILLAPADHFLPDAEAFRAAVHEATTLALEGWIVTMGVTPQGPETGYGYIRAGAPLGAGAKVRSFTEKPDPETARAFLAEGGYYWNAGLVVATAAQLLAELEEHAPKIRAAAQAAVVGAEVDLDFLRLDAAPLADCPSLSLDYALLEHTERAAVLPVSFEWSDLGAWSALWQIEATGASQNAEVGNVVVTESTRSYVRSEGPLVAVSGVEDLVVVATPDAVLVTDRRKTEAVRPLLARLKAEGHAEATEHRKVHRPWGSYEQLALGERFQVKRIMVHPGGTLSLQSHMHRAEHWVVVSGSALVTVNDEEHVLTENQSIYVPLGAKHRLANRGKLPLTLIEVQSGAYLGEDDITRFDDVYRRD